MKFAGPGLTDRKALSQCGLRRFTCCAVYQRTRNVPFLIGDVNIGVSGFSDHARYFFHVIFLY